MPKQSIITRAAKLLGHEGGEATKTAHKGIFSTSYKKKKAMATRKKAATKKKTATKKKATKKKAAPKKKAAKKKTTKRR